jgi:phosphate transport system ATP-binding protein
MTSTTPPDVADVPGVTSQQLPALEVRRLSISYGGNRVVHEISMTIPAHRVVAFIGPTGSGKSSVLRAFNRMNDLIEGAEVDGQVLLLGEDLYAPGADPVAVRRHVGMLFSSPNPFPMSVFDNVAFGARLMAPSEDVQVRVEEALRKVDLWDDVVGKLSRPARDLSWEQQQRLCLARTLAVDPDVILMDEPTNELDPMGKRRLEQLIRRLSDDYTIVLATNSMQQAARVSDFTAYIDLGRLIEYDTTDAIFTNPRDERTEAYVTGRAS